MMKVIEVTPNCNVFSHEFLAEYSDEDLIEFAKENEDTVKIHHSLEEFSEAFNTGLVSDQGYIFFVDEISSKNTDVKSGVGDNMGLDRETYPFCYFYQKGAKSVYGVTKTKEEAVKQLQETIDKYETN